MTLNDIGFPSQSRQVEIQRRIALLRARINDTTDEAVTGRLSDPARSRNGRIAGILEMEKSLSDLGHYGEIIALSETRAMMTQTSLDQIRELVISTTTTAQTALAANSKVPLETVSQTAHQNLAATISNLNVALGGRSLFAGDAGDRGALVDIDTLRTATVPLLEAGPDAATAYAAIDAAFTAPGGLFETTLYTGGIADAPATEVATGERIGYAIRGDDEQLRPVLRDLAVLAAAFDPTNAITDADRAKLAGLAVDGLRNSVDGLAGLSARVGTAEQRIARVKARNIAEEAALTISYNNIAGRDQFSAVAELKSLEGQLESLFVTTTRIANLSLTQFLR